MVDIVDFFGLGYGFVPGGFPIVYHANAKASIHGQTSSIIMISESPSRRMTTPTPCHVYLISTSDANHLLLRHALFWHIPRAAVTLDPISDITSGWDVPLE